MKTAILFDLDGTLLDTLTDLEESLNQALSAYGAPKRTREEVRRFVGNGLPKLVERALQEGTANPQYETILAETRRIYKENSRNHTAPYEGILPMLQTLYAMGFAMGVVSNKPDAEVKKLCSHFFGEMISVAIGANEMRANKPAPDNLLAAMAEMGVSPAHAVYVGDSEVDIETARNTNLPCISVLWGFRDLDVLDAHGAVYCVRSPKELTALLQTDWTDRMPKQI